MEKSRKIFFVMEGGDHDTDRHYFETIERKRSVQELSRFLTSEESSKLARYFKEKDVTVDFNPMWVHLNEGDDRAISYRVR